MFRQEEIRWVTTETHLTHIRIITTFSWAFIWCPRTRFALWVFCRDNAPSLLRASKIKQVWYRWTSGQLSNATAEEGLFVYFDVLVFR